MKEFKYFIIALCIIAGIVLYGRSMAKQQRQADIDSILFQYENGTPAEEIILNLYEERQR